MTIAADAPGMVLRYPGSKWGIAPWIIKHFPAHEAYVEPFMGSLAVLLRKTPARTEIVNDLDGELVTYFRVLRERPLELARALALTPYARDELEACRSSDGVVDDLERARRFAVRCWQTRGGPQSRRSPGWRVDTTGGGRRGLAWVWADLPDRIVAVADRLRGVAIENRPALEVIAAAGQRGARSTLIYADPPYLGRTRIDGQPASQYRLYQHELSIEDHRVLLEALDAHPGPVVLSGYPDDLYDEVLTRPRWHRAETTTRNQLNVVRTEMVWTKGGEHRTSLWSGTEFPT